MNRIQIFDARQALIDDVNVDGQWQHRIDVDNYAAGLYFVKVTTGAGSVYKRIVIE